LSKTFDRKAEAEAFEDSVRAAKRAGVQVRKQSNQTLEAFGLEYVEKYARVELAAATVATNRQMWNKYVLPKLGKRTLVTVANDPEVIQEFKAILTAEGVGAPTIKRTLAVVSAVLGKAVVWNRITRNPVATVRKPSAKRQRAIVPLAPKTVELLRAAMSSGRDQKLVSVIAYGGLRIGEALALEGADVGLKGIHVARALKLDGVGDTKTHKERLVPLLAPLAEDLGGIDDELLFPGHDGEPWTTTAFRNWRRRVWQPACVAVGIGEITITESGQKSYNGPSPKYLRHSCASLLLAEGRNPIEVAETMGHSPQVPVLDLRPRDRRASRLGSDLGRGPDSRRAS